MNIDSNKNTVEAKQKGKIDRNNNNRNHSILVKTNQRFTFMTFMILFYFLKPHFEHLLIYFKRVQSVF